MAVLLIAASLSDLHTPLLSLSLPLSVSLLLSLSLNLYDTQHLQSLVATILASSIILDLNQ